MWEGAAIRNTSENVCGPHPIHYSAGLPTWELPAMTDPRPGQQIQSTDRQLRGNSFRFVGRHCIILPPSHL